MEHIDFAMLTFMQCIKLMRILLKTIVERNLFLGSLHLTFEVGVGVGTSMGDFG